MNFLILGPYYVKWHYSQALKDMKNIWRNCLAFIANFFSIKELAKSLFSPWQRIQVNYSRNFSFEGTIGSWIVNLLMRAVGFAVRLIFILFGFSCLLLCLLFGIVAVLAWLFWPLVIICSFILGLNFLFL